MYIRQVQESDKAILAESLSKDSYHQSTKPEFFFDPRSLCNVYEDEQGPIIYVRATKALRVDIQFFNNTDFARNRMALVEGFPSFVENARKAGFSELIFCSDSPLLRRFCKREFNFVESAGELRKFI